MEGRTSIADATTFREEGWGPTETDAKEKDAFTLIS